MTTNAKNPEPAETCPEIDRCKGYLEDAGEALAQMVSDMDKGKAKLEELRAANAALRKWGAEEKRKADAAEARLAKLEAALRRISQHEGDSVDAQVLRALADQSLGQ